MESYRFTEEFILLIKWSFETAWRSGAEGDAANLRYLADALTYKNLNDVAVVRDGIGWYPITAKRREQGWFLG